MANYLLARLPQASQNLRYFFQPRLSQTHMASFVRDTTSHLQARMGKNKAFRNSYSCGVLKHTKIRAWILAGQWKKILASNTSSWKKNMLECRTWTSTGKTQWLNDSTADRVKLFLVPLQGRMTFPSLGGLYKGDVGGAGLISHPRERQQEWGEEGCGVPTLMWSYGSGLPTHGGDH